MNKTLRLKQEMTRHPKQKQGKLADSLFFNVHRGESESETIGLEGFKALQ